MPVIVSTRFEVDPSDVAEMLSRRGELISAVRKACPGLAEARLARIDDQRWIDIWRWDSPESLQAALDAVAAGGLPEREAAFALLRNPAGESANLVDER